MSPAVMEALWLRAQQALSDSPFHDLRKLRVEPEGEALAITGTVGSFYHKQVAQEAVRSVCKSIELVNRIVVRETDGSGIWQLRKPR